jgi:hypothetical protein
VAARMALKALVSMLMISRRLVVVAMLCMEIETAVQQSYGRGRERGVTRLVLDASSATAAVHPRLPHLF